MKKFQRLFAVMLIGLLQSSVFGQLAANAQTTGVYTVNVQTPGTFGLLMLQYVENWTDVVELTVTGHLNSDDMAYFSRMQNMTKLDVSQTDITSVSGCNGLALLETVSFPESVKTIGSEAFMGCKVLSGINLSNIETIGDYAFRNCSGLTGAITGPKVKSIGKYAFSYCANVETISFPEAEIICEDAFEYMSKLTSADVSKCEELGSYCFNSCSILSDVKLSDNLQIIPNDCFSSTGLQKINLPSNLKTIEDGAFHYSPLQELVLPEGFESIYSNAFYDCPLTSISIPSTIQSIDGDAFYYNSYNSVLSDVYCYAVVPINSSAFNSDFAKSATLHVPAFSVSAYKLDDNWYKFNKIEALEGELSDVTINNTFTIVDYKGLAETPNLTLTSSSAQNIAAHLTVSSNEPLSLGNFIQTQNFQYVRDYLGNGSYFYYYPYCTSLIPNNDIKANSVSTKIQLPTNQWSFISLPYDVNVSDVKVPEGVMWVVRKYNGANRAAMSGDTWENVTSGQMLNAGEGYIFHCVDESGSSSGSYVEFEFPAVNNGNKNNVFAYNDVTKTLNEYPAEFSHNRGWNLIGNPYPAYFNSQYIDFAAPITVWNGSGYTAYSLTDDDYILRPNEAFFVQCKKKKKDVTFSKEGRTHDYLLLSNSSYSNARARSNDSRSILNFVLSDDNYSDRARLVINDAAAFDYEMDKDASKFVGSNADVPQIYIIDNGVNFAIDERPIGNGEYALGMRFGKEGSYSISLNAVNSDYDVVLIDKEKDLTVNLTNENYTFTASAQTTNNRFAVTVFPNSSEPTDCNLATETAKYRIDGNKLVVNGKVAVSVATIDGKVIFDGIVDGTVELPSGLYILSIDNETYKVVIK